MPIPLSAPEVMNREFPEIRARLLQLGAALDRMDRASGSAQSDARLAKVREALGILANPQVASSDGVPNRAEELQLLFSLAYEANWKQNFDS